MIFSEKFEPLFDIQDFPTVRYVIIVGGRASGKSTAVSHFQHDLSYLRNHVILNTRFTMASARDSVIAEMRKTLLTRNSENIFKIINNSVINSSTGAKIIFKGIKAGSLSQTANLKSITDLNIWIVDEAEELTNESTFDDADDSIRRLNYQNLVILVLNSHHITKEHFIYQRFFEDKGVNWGFNGIKDNILYIHTTFLDNWANLAKSYQNKIKILKNYYDKYQKTEIIPKFAEKYINKYKYNFLGELRSKAEGVVLSNWKFGELPDNLPYIYASDIGATDPDTLIKVAFNRKNKFVYVDEIFYQTEQSNFDYIKQIKKHLNFNDILIIDSAAKKTILDIKKLGYNVKKSKKYPGSVVQGIKKLYDYTIIVTPTSKNIAFELNHYVWLDKRGEVPLDDYNHTIDPLRYAIEFFDKYY